MKKQRNRQRSNQKKQREKSTQRVTSARRDDETRHRSSLRSFAHQSAMLEAMSAAALMGAAMFRPLSARSQGKSEAARLQQDFNALVDDHNRYWGKETA